MTGGFKQAEISLETHTERLTGLTGFKLFSWLLLKRLENRAVDHSLHVCLWMSLLNQYSHCKNHLVANLRYAMPVPNKTLMGDVA